MAVELVLEDTRLAAEGAFVGAQGGERPRARVVGVVNRHPRLGRDSGQRLAGDEGVAQIAIRGPDRDRELPQHVMAVDVAADGHAGLVAEVDVVFDRARDLAGLRSHRRRGDQQAARGRTGRHQLDLVDRGGSVEHPLALVSRTRQALRSHDPLVSATYRGSGVGAEQREQRRVGEQRRAIEIAVPDAEGAATQELGVARQRVRLRLRSATIADREREQQSTRRQREERGHDATADQLQALAVFAIDQLLRQLGRSGLKISRNAPDLQQRLGHARLPVALGHVTEAVGELEDAVDLGVGALPEPEDDRQIFQREHRLERLDEAGDLDRFSTRQQQTLGDLVGIGLL